MVKRKPKETVVSISRNHWRYDLIAIGASAGGLSALTEVLRPMATDSPAILVVQHLDPQHKSHLAELVARKTAKQVKQAEHGEPILPAFVYIAPPDEHMLVGPGKIQLVHSQLVHFSRPSIDLMFESVAGMYGSRSVGVILSGSNRDGAAGIRAIREAGGMTVAQDPATAEFRSMPQASIDTGCVDLVLPLNQLGMTLTKILRGEHIEQ